ncbi:integrase arm-type DNA-binding domain-containing protein [Glaesserella parasuis]|uniref:Tyrosine-type recombinase/integrase n=4 Tax=Glaesserella parasuis TaxID=738 RepID=A0A859IGD3_GLAPU|nr:integrase arm-type DNA-binding domain-containing protein [Glaesserella parasuis]AGO15810.1 prophage integrase [Glaesserella parasuis ZJ0906]AWY45228.1 integrase [Glaesserella parasuis 29755]KDD80062.1 integrase [Glaesserella parasuis ST4-1]MCT8547842.1 tyrosine-type recombinase/integrase [Glaesserella parasuis]MCT8552055.1 tyrosine-type recombinase/integrase [Glaesserella parasuis]
MARTTKPLTNTEIANAKPKDKKYPLTDGGGLFLLVKPNGAKLWRFNYYKPYTKNRTEIGLGSYPDVNLARAREIREEYRSLLSQNIDPHTHRQAIEQAKQTEIYNTFENVAWAWYEWRQTRANFSQGYARDVKSLIERILLPAFGKYPITQISAPMALKAFKPLQEKGTLETLKRAIQKMNEIMTFALHREIIQHNPLINISKEFDSPTVEHFKTIKPEDLSEFLFTLNTAQIQLQTRYLILWQLLTMTRPNEAATAKYEDIDEKEKIWTIYINKGIKQDDKGREHKITLSRQALALLREIKKFSGGKVYLFPSHKNPQTHTNTQTANAAIKRMGYKGKLVAHGLRSIASTYLNEKGYNPELIEVALSHINQDRIRMAYNRADYIKQRFEILQAWADFIDECSQGALPQYHLKKVA